MTTALDGHITVDERGVARVAGTRSRVTQVVMDLRNGLTPQQIVREYPHLSLAQVHAALTYYYDHQAQLDEENEREFQHVEAMRANARNSPTREQLQARLIATMPMHRGDRIGFQGL